MALEIFAVQTALPTTSSGTTDLVHASVTTTPVAAVHFSTQAIANDTARNTAKIGIGATDGTTEGFSTCSMVNNFGTTDTNHLQGTDGCMALTFDASSGVDGKISHNSFIAGGQRVDNTDGFGAARLCNSLFFAGCTAGMAQATLNGTDTINVDPGFAWDCCIFFACPKTATSATTQAEIYFGFFDRTNQGCIAFNSQHGQPAGDPSMQLSTTYCGMELNLGSGSTDYGITAAVGSGTSLDLTPGGAGGDTDNVHCLFLGWTSSESVSLFEWSTPDADSSIPNTADDAQTGLGFQPQALINLVSFADGYDTAENTADAGAFGISIETAADQFCVSITDEYASPTTDTQSMVDNKAVNVETHTGALGFQGTLTAMQSDGFEHQFTDSTLGKKALSLAFGVVSSGSGMPGYHGANRGIIRGASRGVG